MTSYIDKYFRLFFIGGIILGLLFSFFFADHQILTGDQYQMIEKGYNGAYTGKWESFGNAASAVGNVPGSLSSVIVGWPLMAWDSPWAPMGLLIVMHLISFLLFDSIIKHLFNSQVRFAFLILYWLNPWLMFENLLYNPSYLFLFSALHFWSAFHMRSQRSFWYTFIHILSIGLAMQLHYSWIILPLISLYLFYKRVIHVSWSAVFTAGALTLISLLPYFHEYMNNSEIRQNPGNKDGARYIGWGAVHVYPIFKALIYWLRYGSFYFSNKQLLNGNYDWLSMAPWLQQTVIYSWKGLVQTLGILSLWITWKANRFGWEKLKGTLFERSGLELKDPEQWLLTFAAGAIIAILISAALSPIIFSYWHLIITFGFALIPIVIYIAHFQKSHPTRFLKYIFMLLVYFLLINFVTLNYSEKYSYTADYSLQTTDYVHNTIKLQR